MRNAIYFQVKEAELHFLAKEKKKNPELFAKKTFIDTSDILQSIGIFNTFLRNLPLGYLKLWPQDFIVEEITKDNTLQTIESGPFFREPYCFSETDPTIYATLVKTGLSTIEAQEELAKVLNLEKKSINFAGIKDKDTISSQLISLRGCDIESLQKINHSHFFLKNVYSGKGIVEVGSLKGNRFTILVRTDKTFQEEKFLASLEKINNEGFWNFFYLQRFGSPRLISHLLGLFLLRREYEKVIYNFLTYQGNRELLYFQKLRGEIKRRWKNWSQIEDLIRPFPIIFRHEKKLLGYLKKHPRDFLGALKEIPEQIQLWIFAYASYLFNRKLSQLIREKKEIPEVLPLILSKDKRDWQPYSQFLKADKISFPLRPLKFFPFLQFMRREIRTREKIELHKIKIIPEGIILSFSLPKAAYATTFLAHLFTLASGSSLPSGISQNPIDTKATLGTGDLTIVLNRFRRVIYPKTEDILERFE